MGIQLNFTELINKKKNSWDTKSNFLHMKIPQERKYKMCLHHSGAGKKSRAHVILVIWKNTFLMNSAKSGKPCGEE